MDLEDVPRTGADSGAATLAVRLTASAIEAVQEMVREADLPRDGGLRIRATTGAGCSAPLRYAMVLEAEPDDDDVVLEAHGVRIFMDPESAWVLDGLLVDYLTDSPRGEGFAFRHPRGPSGRAC